MERLQKVIAEAGVASRRKAEEMILEGKVKVNGIVVKEMGTKVSSKSITPVNVFFNSLYFLFTLFSFTVLALMLTIDNKHKTIINAIFFFIFLSHLTKSI